MLNFHLITLFPEFVDQAMRTGILNRAQEQGQISVKATNLRDFALNDYGQVDDSPYGGGSGLVLRPEPAHAAIEAARKQYAKSKVIAFTPRGKVLNQELAQELVNEAMTSDSASDYGLILLCPRYEGIDERICEQDVDLELSIGDYILMGGEAASLVFLEVTSRLVPGVLGNPESALTESFNDGLLEHPHYTKPQEFLGQSVPPVLLSGNHEAIAAWRKSKSIDDTVARRPELIPPHHKLTCEFSVALIHHPVLNKRGDIVTSSITNIDLHDIARSAKTYGVTRFYIVHPVKTLRRLAAKICDHWATGYGATYNPNRSEALELINIVPDFDDVILNIEARTKQTPKIIATTARAGANSTKFSAMRALLRTSAQPHLLILGTGWGLADEYFSRASYRLEPINGPTDYNHLSVRGAAAIMFDRLLG